MSDDNYNSQSVDATLARIEAKLDVAITTQGKQAEQIEDLKAWRWFSAGIGAAAGFLADRVFGK